MRRKRSAITALETLVVIAILGVLIALLLPAVQHARESGRRTQCRNSLKLLGEAMLAYHAKHERFPPGITARHSKPDTIPSGTTEAKWVYYISHCDFVGVSSTCDDPTVARVSGLTLILPFLGEHSIYGAYNLQLASCSRENSTATSRPVRSFVCPSNPRQQNPIRLPYFGTHAGAAPTDYVLSMGGIGQFDCSNPFWINTGGPRVHFPGIMRRALGAFNVNSDVSLTYMKDGPSNTILMGESVGGAGLYAGLIGTSIVEGAQRMDAASTTVFCDNPWSMGYISSRSGGATQGYGSVFGATAWNAWYDANGNLTDPANDSNWIPYPINEGRLKFNRPTWAQSSRPTTNTTATNGSALPSGHGSAQGYRSYHPNVAQFLLGDGSVRSLSESMDARILVGLSSIKGNEPLEQE